MRAVRAIAVSVFKESVRDKVLYNLVLFAVLLMAVSYRLGLITAGQEIKIVKDLGLSATSIFGLFIAVFIGIGLVWKEVERRSIYSLLAKPIHRHQFIIGKYLGLLLTLAVNLSVMALALYGVLAFMLWAEPSAASASWESPVLDPNLLKAFLLIFVQLALVTALALFFSTFSSPMLSAFLTFGLYIVGHFDADLRHFEAVLNTRSAVLVARILYYLVPNMAPFDIKADIVHGQAVPFGYLATTVGYGALYSAAVLVAATVIFVRRDFK